MKTGNLGGVCLSMEVLHVYDVTSINQTHFQFCPARNKHIPLNITSTLCFFSKQTLVGYLLRPRNVLVVNSYK